MPFEEGNQHGLSTRFPAGESGNPAGYPEGKPNRGTLLRKMLAKEIDYKDPSTGQYARGTIEEAITLAMLAAASNGDVMAYKEIMDSVYGKVTDKVQVSAPAKTIIKIGGKRPAPPDAAEPASS
jgi:hypothetical protein